MMCYLVVFTVALSVLTFPQYLIRKLLKDSDNDSFWILNPCWADQERMTQA